MIKDGRETDEAIGERANVICEQEVATLGS